MNTASTNIVPEESSGGLQLPPHIADHTEQWRLAMSCDDHLNLLIYNPADPGGSLSHRIAVDPSSATPVQDAIYACGGLVQPWARVDWVCRPGGEVAVPSTCTAGQAAELYAAQRANEPEPEAESGPWLQSTATANASVVFGVPAQLAGFLNRTFQSVTLWSSMGLLIDHFAADTAGGNSRRMYVNFRAGGMEIVVIDRNRLLHALSVKVASPVDAAYYIMAVRRIAACVSDADPVVIAGFSDEREECVALVRRMVAQVLPAIFPSELVRDGRESMSLPYDVISIALSNQPSVPVKCNEL